MKHYQITESVTGRIVIIRATNPVNALKRYLDECVLWETSFDCGSWNFDFEIEEKEISEIMVIKD